MKTLINSVLMLALAGTSGALRAQSFEPTPWVQRDRKDARPLEYGHSKIQAPQGMVRITALEFSQYVAKAIGEL